VGLVWKLRLPPEATRLAHTRYTKAQKALLAAQNGEEAGLAAPMPAPVLKG
jgi:hypothetical protein